MVNGFNLKKVPCLEHQLVIKFSPDHKWNSYMQSVAKDTGKIVGSFYHSRKYLTPPIIPLTRIRFDQNWIMSDIPVLLLPSSHLPVIAEFKRFYAFLFSALQSFFNRWHVATLSLFPCELFKHVTFISSTNSDLYDKDPPCHIPGTNYPHSLRIPLVGRKFQKLPICGTNFWAYAF